MNLQNLKNKKDLLFYVALAIIGGGFMYYIFFIDGKEDSSKQVSAGLIAEVPDGNVKPLRSKKEAYENARYDEGYEGKMKSLQDYMFDLTSTGDGNEVGGLNPYQEAESDPVVSLKENLNTTNQRIYEDFDQLAIENQRMSDEIARLRKEKSAGRMSQEDKMNTVKEILKMYAPKEEVTPEPVDEHADALEVYRPEKDVVTTLAEELYLDMPYNAGFITAVGAGYETGRNTIKACIYEDIEVANGERVMLKLLEPLQAGNTTIPKNQLIAGTARIQGDRMDIIVNSIEFAGNIIPVHLKVFDTDGVNGIYCPGSLELTAAKEAAANAGSGIGSISIAKSAGQQIAMDVTRSVMQGGSQLLSRKMRMVKVTLKANYQVLLLPQK